MRQRKTRGEKARRADLNEGKERRTIERSPGPVCLISKFSSYRRILRVRGQLLSHKASVVETKRGANEGQGRKGTRGESSTGNGTNLKLLSVYRVATGSILLQEVSALNHEVLDHTVWR